MKRSERNRKMFWWRAFRGEASRSRRNIILSWGGKIVAVRVHGSRIPTRRAVGLLVSTVQKLEKQHVRKHEARVEQALRRSERRSRPRLDARSELQAQLTEHEEASASIAQEVEYAYQRDTCECPLCRRQDDEIFYDWEAYDEPLDYDTFNSRENDQQTLRDRDFEDEW